MRKYAASGYKSVLLLARLLAIALPGQGFLDTALFAGLQVKRMPLDFLDDVFLLHLPLKAAESIFQRLAFL